MASEDSDQFISRLLTVHRLCDQNDLEKAFSLQMTLPRNEIKTDHKLLKISLFRRPERMLQEERDDRLLQVLPGIDDVLPEMLTVVVVALVPVKPAYTEELFELLEARQALLTLRHHEPMRHLDASSVALPVSPVWLPDETDGETTFSVYKTDDPTQSDQPFLLIVRTRHVVTIVNAQSDVTMSSAGYSDIPAYSRLHRRDRSRRGQRSCLSKDTLSFSGMSP